MNLPVEYHPDFKQFGNESTWWAVGSTYCSPHHPWSTDYEFLRRDAAVGIPEAVEIAKKYIVWFITRKLQS